MAIAACTAAETPAPYCDFGPEIFACAPSNGDVGQPAIFTTDRQGQAGYNCGDALRGDADGNYTNDFGGTSAAAPLAAGIAALVLSVNPELTVAQVRDVLRQTADRVGDASSYDMYGHSDRFGCGRLNAAKAVRAAREYGFQAVDTPMILGPASWSRGDVPPTFQVNPRPNSYYVVEVATRPELFNSTTHSHDRSEDNFYGSWSDCPFQSSPTYTLPAAVWLRLRPAGRLWYRVGSSASGTAYADYVVSTPDNLGQTAPSIELLSWLGAPAPTPEAARRTVSELTGEGRGSDRYPVIEGPLHMDRRMGPPAFRIEPEPVEPYSVEVSTDPEYFDTECPIGDPTGGVHYTSGWLRPGRDVGATRNAFRGYALPRAVWEKLRGANKLYYRLTTRSDEPVVGPVCLIDMSGQAGAPTMNGEAPYRSEEALWRSPTK